MVPPLANARGVVAPVAGDHVNVIIARLAEAATGVGVDASLELLDLVLEVMNVELGLGVLLLLRLDAALQLRGFLLLGDFLGLDLVGLNHLQDDRVLLLLLLGPGLGP
jgi:hypothetical protein